jgi:transposase
MDENQDKLEEKNRIYDSLKQGMSKKDSAILAGISEATFYRWIEEDESFKSRVEASILEYKQTLIKNVNLAAVKDGKLALEVLKRRFPKEWDGSLYKEDSGERGQVVALLQKVYLEESNL